MGYLGLVALVVDDYDESIRFFVDVLGFDLIEDSPSLTNDGRPKRWVVVRPVGAETGILLSLADGPDQRARVGDQTADVSASSSRSTASMRPTDGWRSPASHSSGHRAMSRAAASSCSRTSAAIAGTSSARCRMMRHGQFGSFPGGSGTSNRLRSIEIRQ